MTLSPDEIYRRRAASDPLAPITLWFYPELRKVPPSEQRSMLNEANLKALRTWASYAMCAVTILVMAVRVWVVVAEQVELRGATSAAWYIVFPTWLILQYLRTRALLRSAVSARAAPLLTANNSLQRP